MNALTNASPPWKTHGNKMNMAKVSKPVANTNSFCYLFDCQNIIFSDSDDPVLGQSKLPVELS